MTLFFELVLMPPIIYESSLTLITNVKVFARIGSLCLQQVAIIAITCALLKCPDLIFGDLDVSMYLILLIQLNDYVGSVEPHIQMTVQDYQKNEESLSFL